MEVRTFKQKNRNLLYSPPTTGTYHKYLAIWKKFPSRFDEFGPFVFKKKPLT
jgi:hypothetical protein